MRKQSLIVLAVLGLCLQSCMVVNESPVSDTSCVVNQEVVNDHPASAAMDAVIDSLVADGLVGGSTVVISRDKGRYQRAFGVADINQQLATQSCQRYRVASLTKVLTATATLLLVQDGVVSLDTKVGEFLDSSQVSGITDIDEISVAQLLNHTSGVPNYDDDERFAPLILNNPGSHITLEQKLNLVRTSGGRVPEWVIRKFGQIYSNTNYLLLQLIIEKASGMDYEEFARARIIEPLGLTHTSFGTEDPFPDGLATGYVDFYGDGKMRDVNLWDAHRFDAEGDLISTASDLATFYQALLSGQLVRGDLLEEMKRRRLGMLQETFELENALGHDGIALGYSAEMWYLEESGLLVVLLSNQGRLINENWSVLTYENLLRALIHAAR